MKCFMVTSFVLSMLLNIGSLCADKEALSGLTVDVRPQQYEKTALLIGYVGNPESRIAACADALAHDLSFSQQFSVSIKSLEAIPSKKQMQAITNEYVLALFLTDNKQNKSIEWRLYDIYQQVMIQGKRYKKKTAVVQLWAHGISDLLWPILTGQDGIFSSRIAYCKDVDASRKRPIRHIYVADYDGCNAQLLVATPTVKFAPRWNKDKDVPLLFYSECKRANTGLSFVTMAGRRHVVTDADGINMLLSFAESGDKAVYCASRGRASCQLYYCADGVYKQITQNHGNNIAPTFDADGNTIYFCSDYKKGFPAIYSYDLASGIINDLITDGYSVSPSYCAKVNKLVYAEMVERTLQLCIYDIKTKTSEQVTFDVGDKEECSWSPCGNYLLYSVRKGMQNRVAMFNLITKSQQWITPESENCSYPAWSSIYNQYPLVVASNKSRTRSA